MKHVRIFVSSPGDVLPERRRTEQVIQRLGLRFSQVLSLEPVFWEWEPLTAGRHFQANIVPPSETDLAVLILWSRLGTPLPLDQFQGRITGRQVTGTEWEFEDALGGFQEHGRPDLLVYIKKAPINAFFEDPDDPRIDDLREDKRRLDRFLKNWFWDEQAKVFKGSQRDFRDTSVFEEMLERHLEKLLSMKCAELGGPRPSAAHWLRGSPFRGLQPFDVEHSPIFFGRARARNDLREALAAQVNRGTGFVVVMGASGSGKSSLVKAGLIPDLLLPGMMIGVGLVRQAVLRPRDHDADPVGGLASAMTRALPELQTLQYTQDALARLIGSAGDVTIPTRQGLDAACRGNLGDGSTARLLIVVDQLEELFTYPIADEVRRQFILALDALARSARAWVIATMRSDFLARFVEVPELVDLARAAGTFLLSPPTAEELGQIILRPAELAGLEYETDIRSGRRLDEELRRAAGSNPGTLPLLEYLLERLWQERDPAGRLTFDAYERLGGLEGAIGLRAEELFLALSPDVQAALPVVLRALVAASWGDSAATAMSRAASISSFPEEGPARRLVDALQAPEARLLVVDGDQVRVAHEALLNQWGRAARQIAEDQRDLRTRDRIEREATEWQQAPIDSKSGLLIPGGVRLADAQDLFSRRRDELSALVREYIEASLRENSAQEARELARERQRRLDAEVRRARAEAAEKRAEAERGFARAERNRALARRVALQWTRPDREQYLNKLQQRAKAFDSQAEDAWRAGYELERQLKVLPHGDSDSLAPALRPDCVLDVDVVAYGGRGGSFLLRYGDAATHRLVIVEGGDAGAYKRGLRERLEALRARSGTESPLSVELALITHYDIDRVAGIAQLLQEVLAARAIGKTPLVEVKAVWFNHFLPEDMERPRTAHVHGSSTAKALIPRLAAELGVELNDPFDYFVLASERGPARASLSNGLTATVIAPDANWLQGWYRNWRKAELGRGTLDGLDRVQQTSFAQTADEELASLDEAVGSISEGFSSPAIELLRAPPEQESLPPPERPDLGAANLSSIVTLFEFRGRKILFTGDSRVDQITAGLSRAGLLPPGGSLHVDVLQVPHFGSARNVSPEFFRRVTADHYVIVPHRMFKLPGEEVLSMIVKARGEAAYQIHLPTITDLPWLKPACWDELVRARVVISPTHGFTISLG